ncbi:amidohydrolase [Evtepia sp.]|uniref:amidohydrolase n=1 Tax=Evtepia sp. TaxID=2773933 RepID=UPI003F160AE4
MDTIFYNGRVHTMAGRTVSALAVQGARIAMVGSDEAVLALADENTRRIDLQGRCVLPGFVDTHMHLLLTGEGFRRLDLRGVRSPEEIVARGRDYVASHELAQDEWIIGYGFDQNIFDPPVLPDGAVAEAISSDHPVVLDRVCGHVGAGNAKALALAGYDETTVIPGGELDKDAGGKLTGVVREAALDQLKKASPRLTQERVEFLLEDVGARMAAVGLTGVHSDDLAAEGTDWPTLKAAFDALEARNAVPLRLWEEWETPRPDNLRAEILSQPLRSFQGSDWLKVGNVKLIADGSLGARTALLREDYSDDPGNRGIAVYTQAEMDEMVALCHDNDLQVACHAIGDGATASFLAAVEKAQARDPKPLCHRVVHCQFGDRTLYEKMAALGMGADVQPAFSPSDAPLTPSRMGERTGESYAWKTLLDLGVVVGGGSDCPVEDFAPLWGIHCAVNRPRSHEDDTPFLPDQALTVEEAVSLYTVNAARLVHAEAHLGTLEAGKLADLVVLAEDLFTADPKTIKDIPVDLTMAGGRVTHQR